MQQPGAKRQMGGHRFQMGGLAPLAPRWRRPCREQGRNEGSRGRNCPGAESLRGAPKSPNNVMCNFSIHLLPTDLRFEHGGAKLASCPGRHLTTLRPCQGGKT